VSVVDLESGKSVFDELVTPPKPVVDYLTEYVHPAAPLLISGSLE
jgi:hypothetical protein